MNRVVSIVVLALFVCAEAIAVEAVKVEAAVDKNTAAIGDRICYTIVISAPKGIEVEFPAIRENIGGFSVRDSDFSKKTFFKKITFIGRYFLDTFEPGKYVIPTFAIKYRYPPETEWSEVQTVEIPVEVESVLRKYPEAVDIRDIKSPVGLPNRYIPLLYALIGVILVLSAAVIYVYLKNRRVAGTVKMASRPPHELAYEKLRALKAKDLPGKGRIEEYYVELSNIVRCYLEERFSLRAPEMTTEEFLSGLKEEEKLSRADKSLLKEFLFHCDLVKFAKYGPSPNEVDLSFQSAEKLVDQTKEI